MTGERLEPTAEQLVARIVEKVAERATIFARVAGRPVGFNESAMILAEVINEEIDAGAFVPHAVLEELSTLPDDYETMAAERSGS